MTGFLKSFVMAFSEYSISPKAKMERNKENCSWILAFLPLVGLIMTVIINRWAVLYPYICDNHILPAVFGAIIPTILAGGTHLEGFFKTVDALRSHKSVEEKLDILHKDNHGGYSAIVVCICYFMVAVGIWSEMPIDGIFVIAFAYIISRALFGISMLTAKHATDNKASLYIPENNGVKWCQVLVNVGYIVVCALLMVKIASTFDNISVATASLVGAGLSYIYYLIVAKRSFGGVTEELGGFFITVCEIVIPIAALFAFKNPF